MRENTGENTERNFGFILTDVARLLRTAFDRRIGDLGLTRSQWWVLTHLYRMNGATQSELAEVLEVEKPSLGKLLDRLEASGWIRRGADLRDRRVRRVYLTEEVEPAMRHMRSIAADFRQDAMAGLCAEEQERFVDVLLHVKKNLMLELGESPDRERTSRGSQGRDSPRSRDPRNGANGRDWSDDAAPDTNGETSI